MLTKKRLAAASLLLIGALTGYSLFKPGPNAEKVRAKVFRAMGGAVPLDPPVVLQEVIGKQREFFIFDGEGRFLRRKEYKDDRIPSSHVGHDGIETWEKYSSGRCRRLAHGELERVRLGEWILSGYWCDPRAPVVVKSNSEESGNGLIALEIEYEGAPFTSGTLLVNRKTWLPHSFHVRDFGFDFGFRFDGFQQCRGRTVVKTIRYGEREVTESYRVVDSASPSLREGREERAGRADSVAFRRPRDTSRFDYDYSVGNHLRTRSVRSKLYVRARVNGEELGWFVFDSGASRSTISREAAASLILPELGRVLSRGIGIGWHYGSLHVAESIQLGIVRMESALLKVADLPIRTIGKDEPVVGLIGADFMSRCVVEYDLRNVQISLYDPFLYELPFGEWLQLTDYGVSPHVWAEFDGHRGHFAVDTGAPGGVFLNPLTVEKLELLENRFAAYEPARGFGGGTIAYAGKVGSLKLGGYQMRDVPAQYGGDVDSGIADRFCDGLIGADVLNRFRVVFDLGRKRIALLDH